MTNIETKIGFTTSDSSELSKVETVKLSLTDEQISEIRKHQEYLKSIGKWGQLRIVLDDAEMLDSDGTQCTVNCDMFLNIALDYIYFFAEDNHDTSALIESDGIELPQIN